MSGLTPSQLSAYERDGFVVLSAFFSPSEVAALKARADALIEGIDLDTHPKTIFKTEDKQGPQTQKFQSASPLTPPSSSTSSDYFLDSADRLHYFFEEKAFDENGKLKVPKKEAINKIGHALHSLDPVYSPLSLDPRVRALARSLSFHDAIILQSMIICKQPRIGGVVVKHRDSTFLYTEPSTAVGFWIALEDADEHNGCLQFAPGSHRDGASDRRLRRAGPVKATVNNTGEIENGEPLDGPDNHEGVVQEFVGEDRRVYADSEFVMAPVKAGSLIVINGEVVHASSENHSDRSRFIYTFHMIEGKGTKYSTRNWLQSKERFTRLYEDLPAKK